MDDLQKRIFVKQGYEIACISKAWLVVIFFFMVEIFFFFIEVVWVTAGEIAGKGVFWRSECKGLERNYVFSKFRDCVLEGFGSTNGKL